MAIPLQLQAFIEAHPPHSDNQRPDCQLLVRYKHLLPNALLELWRENGFGYYGERRLWILNPDVWQSALDQWISNAEDSTQRVPILLTPFGTLLYYCKEGDGEEIISAINILERDISVLSLDPLACFNQNFTDEEWLDDLIPTAELERAQEAKGPLTAGQMYQLDQNLSAIVYIYSRVDALVMFQECFDEMRLCAQFDYPSAGFLQQALPDVFHREIQLLKRAIESDSLDGISGFYLSAHICRYQVLALMPYGLCTLIWWTTHPQDLKTMPPRLSHGSFRQPLTAEGDALIILAMDGDNEGDIAEDQVFYRVGGEHAMLIRAEDLNDVAAAMNWDDSVEHSSYPLRKVSLNYYVPIDSQKLPTPQDSDLPGALRRLLREEPLRVVITQVKEFDAELEQVWVEARVDANAELPGRMNMPMCSPGGGSKALMGWVTNVGDTHLNILVSTMGHSMNGGHDWPEVGDVMISRKP